MSANGRFRTSSGVRCFEAEVQAFPEEEQEGPGVALAMAVAEAAMQAAQHLEQEGVDEAYFEVSRIQIKVAKNPGPTTYRVILTPSS